MKDSSNRGQAGTRVQIPDGAFLPSIHRMLAAIVESSEDAIIGISFEGIIVSWNSAAERLYGYMAEEVVGQSRSLLVPPDYQDDVPVMMERLKLGERVQHYETQRLRKDGRVLHVSVTMSPVRDETGRIVAVSTVARDITDRKMAEEALRVSEANYRAIFDAANDSIFVHDLETFAILDVNQKMTEMFGYAREEARQLTVEEMSLGVPPFSQREAGVWLGKAIETGPQLFEWMSRDKSGRVFWTEVNIKRASIGGQDRLLAIVRDITGRKAVERELKGTLDRLQSTLEGTIEAMALSVEMRDPFTAGHQQRVAALARAVAQEMVLSEEQIHVVRLAAFVHDIGKIGVPAEILSKSGRLAETEFALVKCHSDKGCSILEKIEFPWPVARIVHQHHERMDGSGYPSGLKGEEILLEARIIAVADVVEAMASHRPYRPALGVEAALQEITLQSGVLYDSQVVDACRRIFARGPFRWA